MHKLAVILGLILITSVPVLPKKLKWDLDLPDEHIPYFFFNNPELKGQCINDKKCPYQNHTEVEKCWGYEDNCPKAKRMSESTLTCPQDSGRWVTDKQSQIDMFWTQGDFGYIRKRKDEQVTICEPQAPDDSLLECVAHTRMCRAKNLYMDFTDLKTAHTRDRYRENVFKKGQIGGHCKFNEELLRKNGEHKSPLQSWYAELEQYSSLSFKVTKGKKRCDKLVTKPTIFMKLDAGVNMYHHFCDYVNLYVTQHYNNSFTRDVQIVMWDTSPMKYGDFFHDTWKAFTHSEYTPLSDYDGKKVCFKDAVFAFLPRMRFGLYYNMPLVPGCQGSSIFRAFSQFVTYRLNIKQEGPLKDKTRVTLLSRSTKYRKIMNEDELAAALRARPDIELRVVDFNMKMPFLEQLQVTHNSDIFMGMHGAGLTHMLFQPDWGVGFEIYNCEDDGCYSDLARLRGVYYMTWENKDKLIQEDEGHHPQLGAHAKFTNYAFDVTEFLRMVDKGIAHVKSHKAYKEALKQQSTANKNKKTEL